MDGPEISNKIKSAIKAKLVELGAYVDDELPGKNIQLFYVFGSE
jgi:hypothetical protein